MKAPLVGAFLFRWLKAVQTDYLRKIPFLLIWVLKKRKDALSFMVGVVE
jgi:hypothetical protein